MKGVNFMQIVSCVLHILAILLILLTVINSQRNQTRKKMLKYQLGLSIAIFVLSCGTIAFEQVFLKSSSWIMLIVALMYLVFAIKSARDLKKVVDRENRFFLYGIMPDEDEEGP